jgi:RNA recognition motif-containing protein
MIAQSRTPGKQHDVQSESDLSRIFVVISKSLTEEDLRAKFSDYDGDIDYCQIVRDRETKESKGVGYVKFTKPSTAALAIETCDRSLKAVIAEPKSSKLKQQQKMEKEKNVMSAFAAAMQAMPVNPFMEQQSFNFPGVHEQSNIPANNMIAAQAAVTEGIANQLASSFSNKRLFVIVSPAVTHDQISSLFDLIPGMDYCDLKRDHNTHESRGIAYVMYKSMGSSIYAKEKLNGFEYPPGSRLVVKFAEENTSNQNGNKSGSTDAHVTSMKTEQSFSGYNTTNQGFNTSTSVAGVNPMVFNPIPAAAPFYQAASSSSSSTATPYTTAVLPNPQPFADPSAEIAARLFIVCQPRAPPEQVLKDVFSRFGDLIDVWMVGDRNFGYAKFSSKVSADAAITGLNEQEILGMKVKVLHADPPKNESSRKRPRV